MSITRKKVKSNTNKKNDSLDRLVRLCVANHTPEEMALGWLRYECVRKMNARQFGEICKWNLSGEFFDDLITSAMLDWK